MTFVSRVAGTDPARHAILIEARELNPPDVDTLWDDEQNEEALPLFKVSEGYTARKHLR